jgi:hypothetical protein
MIDNLPPNLAAIIDRGEELHGEAAIARMRTLTPHERDQVIIVLSNGFRAPLGKFLSGEDDPATCPTSDDFSWRTEREEWFDYGGIWFDVRLARELIAKKRRYVVKVDVAAIAVDYPEGLLT